MRKVIRGMQVSLDGYVATVDGKLDWAFAHFDAEVGAAAIEALSQLDTPRWAAPTMRNRLRPGLPGRVRWRTS